MLHPPSPRRERILLYGQEGSGKSHAWVSIAEWIAKTSGTQHVHVIDTDVAWDALRPLDGRLDETVIAYPIHEWDDYATALKEIRQSAGPDDWYVVDLLTPLWTAAQEGYFQKAFGAELDAFFLQAQLDGETPGGEYGTNWVQIRRMYQNVMNSLHRFEGHVMACAAAGQVKVPTGNQSRTPFHDTAEVQEKYGRYGWKPIGGSSKENIGHNFHTVILMVESQGGWKMSVTKDRGERMAVSKEMAGVGVTPDWVMAYLMRHGWRP